MLSPETVFCVFNLGVGLDPGTLQYNGTGSYAHYRLAYADFRSGAWSVPGLDRRPRYQIFGLDVDDVCLGNHSKTG